jgi:hypothetical protein
MNLSNLIVSILDLLDEVLFTIFKKLNNIDLLYSLLGVNSRLDNVVCDNTFSQAVDLTALLLNEPSDSRNNAVAGRFYAHIVPRTRNNVKSFTVQTSFIQCILRTSNYPNLHKLTLVNLSIDMAAHIFSSMSFDFVITKYMQWENASHLYIFRELAIYSLLQISNFPSSRDNQRFHLVEINENHSRLNIYRHYHLVT